MNTDELLVQLDFDETNVNHQRPQPHSQQQQPQQLNAIDSLSSKRAHLQRSASPSLNISEPILTSGDFLLENNDKPYTDSLNASHHRRAFSDDNALATVTLSTQSTQQNHQQSHSNFKTNPTDNLSLINLSRSHSSGDEESIGHLEPTTEILGLNGGEGPSHIHRTDDTVEVSLLADLSMDSRESQPLLGVGRDTHDYVYNNFPGE